jgi:hypothetical protein
MPKPTPPERVLVSAAKRRGEAEAEWREAISLAHRAGLSHRRIAPLAGVSHQRVAQILRGE